jgi:hypothetical protein
MINGNNTTLNVCPRGAHMQIVPEDFLAFINQALDGMQS